MKAVLFLAAAISLVNIGPATACSCLTPDASVALEQSDAVFVGTVDRFHPISAAMDFFGIEQNVTLKVTKAWKGVKVGERVRVHTLPQGFCGFSISESSTWIFYLEGPPYNLGPWARSIPTDRKLSVEDMMILDGGNTKP